MPNSIRLVERRTGVLEGASSNFHSVLSLVFFRNNFKEITTINYFVQLYFALVTYRLIEISIHLQRGIIILTS